MTIMKDDVESIRTMQDAARAAQKRIAALDKADDTSEILAAVNSLLDAVVTDLETLAFHRFVADRVFQDDTGDFSVSIHARCHSAYALDELGELHADTAD